MSITTYGWGSGAITTVGFGGYLEALALVPWMTAEGIFPRRTPTPDYRLRDGVDERLKDDIVVRVKPSMISTRSVDGFGRFDYLSIPARLKVAIATRDRGVIPTRDAEEVGTRDKPERVTKRTRNVIPTRDRDAE
jgi:hypothetical protein